MMIEKVAILPIRLIKWSQMVLNEKEIEKNNSILFGCWEKTESRKKSAI